MHPKLIELEKKFQPSPLKQIFSPTLIQKKIELWIKRDDLIHPVISGNKWRKLKYILDHALKCDTHTLISMGGAYSNHLHALAYVGKQLQLRTIAYIRGEQPEHFGSTLIDLQKWGMQLKFISRAEYRNLRAYKKPDCLPGLGQGEYWLPEGGSTELALRGVGEIVSEIDMDFSICCVPCGTGTTLAGLIQAMPNKQQVYGFSALKGADFLSKDVEILLANQCTRQWNGRIFLDYHFGGYAKVNNELLLFIQDFLKQHDVELEPIYTGKMFYGLFDLIQHDFFEPGQKIVAIHTGGLQGNRAYY